MKKRILYLDRLRFFAILCIILLHIISFFRWKYFNTNTSYFFILTLLDSLTRVGIPIFFMLTGALMFSKKDEEYKEFLKKRVLKLVIAYFIFCAIYFIYNNGFNISIYEFLRQSTASTLEYHLWFMPVIIVIYLFIPFIKKIAINLDNKELLRMISLVFLLGNCLVGLYAILERFNYYLLGNFCLPNLVIFTNYLFIGYYLSNNKVKIDIKLIILSTISIIIIPFLTILISTNEINDVFLNSLSPLVVAPSILVFTLFKNSKMKATDFDNIIVKNIDNIFYVYLLHVLILKIIQKEIPFLETSHSFIIDLLLIPLLFAAVTLLSFGMINLYKYIKKIIINNYKKITKILITIFNIIFVLIFTIIIINLLLNPYKFINMNYLYLIICLPIYLAIFYFLFKYQNKLFNNKNINIVLIILYLIFQIIIINMFIVKPSWDFGAVYEIAVKFANSKHPIFGASYLYLCDNNIPITVLLDIIFKISNIIGYNHYVSVGILLSAIMIDLSLVYTYLLIDKIDNKYSKLFIIFGLFFTPLLLYIPIFYKDIIIMPFIIIPLYYFYNYLSCNDKKKYLYIAFLLLGIIFKIFHLIGYNHYLSVGILLNIIMIDSSLVYTYLLIDKMDNRYSKPFIIFCLFFTPLLLYLPIFYTDTIAMPFIIIPLYYFYNYLFYNDKKKYLYIAFLLLGIGGVIKPTVLIVAIAIIIYLIIFNKKTNIIPLIVLILIIPLLGYKLFLNHFFVKEYIQEYGIPKSHYIMIGLEGEGGFSQEAFEYTTSIKDPIERDFLVRKRIHSRINEMKSKHLFLSFYNKKIAYTWTDGTMFSIVKLNRYPIHKKYIETVNSKNISNLCWTISNIEWIIVLVLIIASVILNRFLSSNLKEFSFILTLSIFGLFLFLIIWETRSRYLVNFIPIFLTEAYIGMISIFNYINARSNNNEK